MLRHAGRAVARTLRRHWLMAALVVLLVLIEGGYQVSSRIEGGHHLSSQTVPSHGATALGATALGATALDITVWKDAGPLVLSGSAQRLPPPPTPPDVQVFEKTVTDVGLVGDAQNQLDRIPLHYGGGGCPMGGFFPTHLVSNVEFIYTYIYEFRFSTHGVTTQVYKGDAYCRFSVSRPGLSSGWISIRGVPLYGVWILEALHQRTGIPCMVNCSDGLGPSDGDTAMPCCS